MWGVLAFLFLDPSPARAATPPPRCDAAAITARANELFGKGLDLPALVEYEQAIKCAPSNDAHKRAAMAACKLSRGRDSGMLARAKRHLDQLPARDRIQIQQMCMPPCDPFQLGAVDD